MSDRSYKIMRLIEDNKISYGSLSKATGISKSALQRYATGKTEKIPIDRLELIAKALNSTPAYLMGWEEIPGENPDLEVGEQEIISIYRKLPQALQEVALQQISSLSNLAALFPKG